MGVGQCLDLWLGIPRQRHYGLASRRILRNLCTRQGDHSPSAVVKAPVFPMHSLCVVVHVPRCFGLLAQSRVHDLGRPLSPTSTSSKADARPLAWVTRPKSQCPKYHQSFCTISLATYKTRRLSTLYVGTHRILYTTLSDTFAVLGWSKSLSTTSLPLRD